MTHKVNCLDDDIEKARMPKKSYLVQIDKDQWNQQWSDIHDWVLSNISRDNFHDWVSWENMTGVVFYDKDAAIMFHLAWDGKMMFDMESRYHLLEFLRDDD
jgi:hypothetical protein